MKKWKTVLQGQRFYILDIQLDYRLKQAPQNILYNYCKQIQIMAWHLSPIP
jgi:hypothetical protein